VTTGRCERALVTLLGSARPWRERLYLVGGLAPKRSACLIVLLGLESVSQETLDAYDKHQTVEDISEGVLKLHEHGILSHCMFVLGADSDTLRTVHDTVDFALANRSDSIMMSALTPLPGTPQYEDLEAAGRIFDHRWEHDDSHHVVFHPKHMRAHDLQHEVLGACGRFYSPRQWLKALLSFSATKLVLKSWGRWTIKSWRKDACNGVFMEELKALPAPG
jgi:anaerobic magnesium-protoporphyrin IX monomethyl ester cyclase